MKVLSRIILSLLIVLSVAVFQSIAFAKTVPVTGFAGVKFGMTIEEIKALKPFGVKPGEWTVEKVNLGEYGENRDNWLCSFDIKTKFSPLNQEHPVNVLCRINSEGKLCQINVTVTEATSTEHLDMLKFLGKYGEPKGVEETGWDGFLFGENPWVLCEYFEGNIYLMYEDSELFEYHGCRH